MASLRRQILEAFQSRLQTILTQDGFKTDAGKAVFLGQVKTLGPDDLDVAIVVLAGDEVPGAQNENTFTDFPVNVIAVAKADLASPWVAVEDVLSDVKAALETGDRTLGGLTSRLRRGGVTTQPRESGADDVGLRAIYVAPYKEKWGGSD